MTFSEKRFDNHFDDIKIISRRLLNFSHNFESNLTAANGGGAFTTYLATLSPLIAAFSDELGDVDLALAIQKGSTLTLNQLIALIKKTMSDEEGYIASVVGGRATAIYLAFYPHGISEYTKAGKDDLETLVNRIDASATTHTLLIGGALTTILQSFKPNWISFRTAQQTQMGSVNDNRTELTSSRTALELVLIKGENLIGGMFPGNVTQCMSFLNYSLLFPHTRHHADHFNGTLSRDSFTIINRNTWTAGKQIRLHNHGDNELLLILADSGVEFPASGYKVINAGETKTFAISDLGSLAFTFILLKNPDLNNTVEWEADVFEE